MESAIIYIILFFALTEICSCSDVCKNSLAAGRNATLSAFSSQYPDYVHGPSRGLLNTKEQKDSQGHVLAGAWVAGKQDTNQFLQVELDSPSIVRGIVTQGRNGCCQQWVTEYKVSYSPDCKKWTPVAMGSTYNANSDQNTPVSNIFNCPVSAKCIRIFPTKWNDKIAMRLDVLGCPIKPASSVIKTSTTTQSTPSTVTTAATTPLTTTTASTTSTAATTTSTATTSASTTASSTIASTTTQATSSTPQTTPTTTITQTSTTSARPTTSPTSTVSSSTSTSTSPSSTTSTAPPAKTTASTSTSTIPTTTTMASTSTLQQTTTPYVTTTSLVSTTQGCLDHQGIDCQMMDTYLGLCGNAVTAAAYCPLYCGLCGPTTQSSLLTTTTLPATTTALPTTSSATTPTLPTTTTAMIKQSTSSMVTSASTTMSTTSKCVDKPGVDCRLLDTSLGICSNVNTAHLYCSNFCGICGTTTQQVTSPSSTSAATTSTSTAAQPTTASGSTAATTATASTSSTAASTITSNSMPTTWTSATQSSPPSTTNACSDKPGVDCHLLDSHLGLCKDIQAAMPLCPRFCGLCGPTTTSLSSPTTPGTTTSTMTHTSTSTARSTTPASITTLSFQPQTATSSVSGTTNASALTSVATLTTQMSCTDQPGIDCHLLDTSLNICMNQNASRLYCKKYCGLCGSTTAAMSSSSAANLTTSTSILQSTDSSTVSNSSPSMPSSTSSSGGSTITTTSTPSIRNSTLLSSVSQQSTVPTTTQQTAPATSSTMSPVTQNATSMTAQSTTAGCVDKPAVDCKLLDTYLNICKDQNTAKSYCPVYCGLCGSTFSVSTTQTTNLTTSAMTSQRNSTATVLFSTAVSGSSSATVTSTNGFSPSSSSTVVTPTGTSFSSAGSTTTTSGSTTTTTGSRATSAGSTPTKAGSTSTIAGSTTTVTGSTTIIAASTTTTAGSKSTSSGSTTTPVSSSLSSQGSSTPVGSTVSVSGLTTPSSTSSSHSGTTSSPATTATAALTTSVSGDTKCLFCKDVIEPIDCDTVIGCGSHEQCYIDQFVTVGGGIRYNLGCRDSMQCNNFGSLGRRRSSELLICSECCSGNVCNSAGCGNQGYPSPRGPLCYNCLQQTDQGDCSKISMCGQDEVCLLQKIVSAVSHKVLYQTRCESNRVCHNELSATLIGRRSQIRPGGSCRLRCCNTDLCNNNCSGSAPKPSITTQTSFRVPTTPGSSHGVMTTPFTIQPSTKSSSVSNTAGTVLTTINAATLTVNFIPTTVQSLCQDKAGVDCHLLNVYLGICSDTATRTSVCMKYCGLCR